MCVDVTTTSVGRATLRRTYDSFFSQVRYAGTFRVIVTVDPAYDVDAAERAETLAYLAELPDRFPRVSQVVVEEFGRQVGLVKALSVLFAHATTPVGVHLEDDWETTAEIDLDGLVEQLYRQQSTAIVFGNEHVARGGTFARPDEVVEVGPLLRLVGASWAKHYLPLCPHLHRTERWLPTVARALAITDDLRCPDERVREQLINDRSWESHNVLWTRQILARDIGREWLSARNRHKAITPEHREAAPAALPTPAGGPLPLHRSHALRGQAEALIPGMTQTFQKRPQNFAEGAYPVYLERGDGALVWDPDGNCYLDFVCSLGAASLGHNHPVVTNTVRDRVSRGVLFSLPAPAEIGAAELLVRSVPGVDQVRFLKTGAEACSAAVRLARARTGRDGLLLAGYHGWHDQLSPGGPGIPAAVAELSRRFALNSDEDDARLLDAVRSGAQVAAVLLSTPYHRELTPEYLNELRAACDTSGILLVLDEVVTGFRLAPGGLGEYLGIRADLVVFSKGIAAGMPLAAVAGPAEVMGDFAALHVSTTFGGELLSLEVAKAALREYARDDYYYRIALLGKQLRDGINAHAAALSLSDVMNGYDPMPCLTLSPVLARLFLGAMACRGVLMRRDVNFISAAHSPGQIEFAVAAAGDALADLRAELR